MAVDKEKILEAAQKYADREQYDKAVREIQKVSNEYRDDCRVQLKLATYLEKDRRTSEAVEVLTHVAEIYRSQGAAQKALAVIKQAQKLEPMNCDLALVSAELCGNLGLSHEALMQLNRSLEYIDPGINREKYGKILQMMVRVDSENTQTRTKYAKFLLDSNDVEGASRQFSLALALLLSKDKLVDYVQSAREYLKIVPDDGEVIKNLAEIYMKMSRYNDAVVIMTDLHEDKRTREIHELLVKCYVQLRRPRDAVRELKVLARKMTLQGERSDMIEDVWRRAREIDPNDVDVIAALSEEELPMLSNSSLGIISVNEVQPIEDEDITATHQRPAVNQVVPSQTDQLNAEFSLALDAYHSGDANRAVAICRRIIEIDEMHLPSLRLLVEISEKAEDPASQAYYERKIAKAVYQRDLNEGIRHIQIAERCTPHAWENYNLMLLFGVDPLQYGMTPPTTSGASSSANRRITKNANTMGISPQTNSGIFRAPNQAPRTTSGMFQVPQEVRTTSGMFRAPQEVRTTSGMFRAPQDVASSRGQAFSSSMGQNFPATSSTANVRVSAPPPVPRSTGVSTGSGIQPLNGGNRANQVKGIPPVPSASSLGKAGMQQIPPIPTSTLAGMQQIPPVPTTTVAGGAGVRSIPPKRRMTTEIPAPMQNISNDVISDLRKLERPQDGGYQQNVGGNGVSAVSTYADPSQSDGAFFKSDDRLDDELDDVFAGLISDEPLKPAKSIVAPIAVPEEAGMPMPSHSQVPAFVHPRAAAQVSAQVPVSQAGVSGQYAAAPVSAQVPVSQAGVSGQYAAAPVSAPVRPSVANHAVTATRGGLSNRVTGVRGMQPGRGGAGISGIRGAVQSSSMNQHAVPVMPSSPVMPPVVVAGAQTSSATIPEDALQRVKETLQEVDFYASLNLHEDAGRLLNVLIDEFGDIDIIHAKKVELGL